MSEKQQSLENVSALDPNADSHKFSELDLHPYGSRPEADIAKDLRKTETFLKQVASAANPATEMVALLSGYDTRTDEARDLVSYLMHGGYNDFQIPQPGGLYVRYIDTPIGACFNVPQSRLPALRFISDLDRKMQVSLLTVDLGDTPIIATLNTEELLMVNRIVTTTAIARHLGGLFPDERYGSARRRIHPAKFIDECRRYKELLNPKDFADTLSQGEPKIVMSLSPEIPVWIQMFNYGDEAQDLAIESINYLLKVSPLDGIRLLTEAGPHSYGSGFSLIMNDYDFDRDRNHTHLNGLFEGVDDAVVTTVLQQSSFSSVREHSGEPDIQKLAAFNHEMSLWIASGMPDSLFLTFFFLEGELRNSIKPELKAAYFDNLLNLRFNRRYPILERMTELILSAEDRDEALYQIAIKDPDTYARLVISNADHRLDVTTVFRDRDGELSLTRVKDLLNRSEVADVLLSLDIDELMEALGNLCTNPESTMEIYQLVSGLFKKKIETEALTSKDVPAIHFYTTKGDEKGNLRASVVDLFAIIQEQLPDEIQDLGSSIFDLEKALYLNLTDLDIVWGVFSEEKASPLIVSNEKLHNMIEPFVTRMFYYDDPFGIRGNRFVRSRVMINFISKLRNPDDVHYFYLVNLAINGIQRVYLEQGEDSGLGGDAGVARVDALESKMLLRLAGDQANIFEDLAKLDFGVEDGDMRTRIMRNALERLSTSKPDALKRLFNAYARVSYHKLGSSDAQWLYSILENLTVSAIEK